MPLTKTLRRIKGNFIQEYGRKKGTNIFYAWEHKNYPNLFLKRGR